MKRFLERHHGRVTGTLSGFDRVLFRGTLRSIAYVSGLEVFCTANMYCSKILAATLKVCRNGLWNMRS
jgi:hypothetical protein